MASRRRRTARARKDRPRTPNSWSKVWKTWARSCPKRRAAAVAILCRTQAAWLSQAPCFFFSSGMADVALWLGPYMSINCQNYICTRTQKVHKCRQIKSHQTTHKTHNQDDPQIPQPDLRFVKKKPANQTDKGARAQTTKPTKRICQGTQRTLPLCHTQKHA